MFALIFFIAHTLTTFDTLQPTESCCIQQDTLYRRAAAKVISHFWFFLGSAFELPVHLSKSTLCAFYLFIPWSFRRLIVFSRLTSFLLHLLVFCVPFLGLLYLGTVLRIQRLVVSQSFTVCCNIFAPQANGDPAHRGIFLADIHFII